MKYNISIVLAILTKVLTSTDLSNHKKFKSTSRQIVLGSGEFIIVENNFNLKLSDSAKGSFITHPDGVLELIVN